MDERNQNSGSRKVLEPEIVQPQDGFSSKANWQQRYQDQRAFSGVWIMPPVNRGGCLAAVITFILFLVCIGQSGVLAGLGFLVFYGIGAIAGTIHASKRLVEGKPSSLMAWRIGNWIISFLLTIWLAGGLRN